MDRKFVAINHINDAVEVIGTEQEVLYAISETYGAAQLDQLRVYEIVGEPLKIKMKLELPMEPA